MIFRDLCLYEIKVEYTHTIAHRTGQDGDYVGETKKPGTRKIFRLVANRFYEDHRHPEGAEHGVMIEAWIASVFRFQEEQDFKILSVTKHDVSFLLS